MKKMNLLHLLLLALLAFVGSYGTEARAIDDDIDNSIEAKSSGKFQTSTALFDHTVLGQDWIKFVKAPPVKVVQRFGLPLEISCEVLGSPLPTIQWVVGNTPLSEIDTIESNVISESSAIVKLRSVHVIEHVLTEARTYTCVGSSGSKTIYASTTVYPTSNVNADKPFTGHIKPRIVYNEKMHFEMQGSNVVLPCKVHARPRAEVFWTDGDGNLIEQNQRYKLLPSGSLLITNLKWEDMGIYTCRAHNILGEDTAEAFIYPVKNEE